MTMQIAVWTLIQHADDYGYYVPVDFPEPLGPYPFPGLKVWERLESTLGSSFGLLRECQDAATLLSGPSHNRL